MESETIVKMTEAQPAATQTAIETSQQKEETMENHSPKGNGQKRKNKRERSKEEQAAYCELRAKKRLLRKAKKRESKAAVNAVKPVYTIERGYRMAQPYVYEFRTFAKERWLGRSLLSMFTEEFGAYTPKYYESALKHTHIQTHTHTHI